MKRTWMILILLIINLLLPNLTAEAVGNTIEDGIRLYLKGSKTVSSLTYNEELTRTWESAFKIFKSHNFRNRRSVVIGNYLINYYKKQGDYGKSHSFSEWTLKMAHEINYGEAQILSSLGDLYFLWGKYDKSLESFDKALNLSIKTKNKNDEANISRFIGSIYNDLGEYSRAEEKFKRALSLCIELLDKEGEGNIYNNMGLIFYNRGNNEKAIEFFKKALKIFKKLKNSNVISVIECNMGNAYLDNGQLSNAKKLFKENNYKIGLGRLFLIKRDFGKSLNNFNSSKEDFGNKRNETQLVNYIGTALSYEGLENFTGAKLFYDKAIKIIDEYVESLSDEKKVKALTVKIHGVTRNEAYKGLQRVLKTDSID